jgi:hypothetical protein
MRLLPHRKNSAEAFGRYFGEGFKRVPRGRRDFVQLCNQILILIGNEEILQIVVHMRLFSPIRFAGHIMAINNKWGIRFFVPVMQNEMLQARFLANFPCGGFVKCGGRFVVAARLKPALDDKVIDQKHLTHIRRYDKGAGCDVTWQRRSLVKRVTLGYLPS